MNTQPDSHPSTIVSYASIQRASHCLKGVVNQTPVMTSRTVNDQINGSVYFKCENFQRIGAFKFRGAYNALSQLTAREKKQGVLTFSSGNHAQAVALSGNLLDISTTIIMPEDAPAVKLRATRSYGAEVILYNKEKVTRESLALKIAAERKLTIIPPYDHPDVIAGQGTTASELIEETGPLDALLVCCGGGGLLSGCAITAKALAPDCEVIGVEPAQADDATRTFYSGILQSVHNPDTIADGARTPSLGKYTFPIVMQHVDAMVTVSEQSIRDTMHFLWERMKLVIEPTGALAATGLLTNTERFQGKRVGVILTGGNVDLKNIGQFFK
ncbi:MAG: threo-3-hydroxy-L-aspartate ammonia-lyase [Rhodothermales bacterium]